MPYIENNLNTGEKINHFAKPSIKPTILVLTVVAPIIFLLIWAVLEKSIIEGVIWAIVISVIILVKDIILIYVSEYAITNKRVISKLGLIRRDVEEMNLGSIESVNLKQSIVGRIFNYGDINISGRGSSQVIFKQADSPVEIRKKIKHKS